MAFAVCKISFHQDKQQFETWRRMKPTRLNPLYNLLEARAKGLINWDNILRSEYCEEESTLQEVGSKRDESNVALAKGFYQL